MSRMTMILVSLAVGFLSAVLLERVSSSAHAAPEKAAAGEDSASLCRYRIVVRDGVRADTWLLDTATGRTWQPTQFTDIVGQPVIWKVQDRVDNQAGFIQWLGSQQVVPKQDAPNSNK